MSDRRLPSETIRRLRTREAAAYLALSARYLEKLRVLGGGPAYLKFGKAVAYDVADLDAWAHARRRSSTSEPLVA